MFIPRPKRPNCCVPPRRAGSARGVGVGSPDEAGVSLVEVVVAIAIFAIVASGSLATMLSSLNLVKLNRDRVVASAQASQAMERIRDLAANATNWQDLNDGDAQACTTAQRPAGSSCYLLGNGVRSNDSVLQNGQRYTVYSEMRWITRDTTVASCGTQSTTQPLTQLSVTITVTWSTRGSRNTIRSTSRLSPPNAAANQANLGTLYVALTYNEATSGTAGGEPLRYVALEATDAVNGSVSRAQTDDDGCATFRLDPGTYNLRVTSADILDPTGSTVTQNGIVITANATTRVALSGGQAASLAVNLKGVGNVAVDPRIPVAYYNAGLASPAKRVSATSRTLGGLYPYLTGYQVWAGSCLRAYPGNASPGWSGWGTGNPTEAPSVGAVRPAQTSAVDVDVPVVKLKVVSPGGAARSGVVLVASHIESATCAGSDTYDSIATTGSDGTATFALPFGSWVISEKAATAQRSTVTLNPMTLVLDQATPQTGTVTQTLQES